MTPATVKEERRGAVRRLAQKDLSVCAGWCWHPRGATYRYSVVYPYVLELEESKSVTVRAGFLTDGATCAPDLGAAFIYHDYLYCTHAFDDRTACGREEADDLMAEVLRRDGLHVYAAVFRTLAWLNPGWSFSGAWEANGRRGAQFESK